MSKERDEAADAALNEKRLRHDGCNHWRNYDLLELFKAGWDAKAGRDREAIEGLIETMQDVSARCLCTRNTFGFDYGEKHEYIGKPGTGKRWLTPTDMIEAATLRARKLLGDVYT